MICLENSRQANYITEKPFQSWFAGTVPIYDGGCVDQLNQRAIINASSTNLLEELQRLDASPQGYEEKRCAELASSRLSLASFESEFRRVVIQTQPLRPARARTRLFRRFERAF
jgi:hypothetical protein